MASAGSLSAMLKSFSRRMNFQVTALNTLLASSLPLLGGKPQLAPKTVVCATLSHAPHHHNSWQLAANYPGGFARWIPRRVRALEARAFWKSFRFTVSGPCKNCTASSHLKAERFEQRLWCCSAVAPESSRFLAPRSRHGDAAQVVGGWKKTELTEVLWESITYLPKKGSILH